MMLANMFRRRWLLTTALVFAGTAVCIRLGFWQLDRLEQRRAFNVQVESMRAAEVLDLNQELPEDIISMEWRALKVTGKYDFEHQVALRNQYSADREYGYHLITPLHFNAATGSSRAQLVILVDRGWIPSEGNAEPAEWRKYDVVGQVSVTGQLRLGQDKPAFGGVADPELSPGQSHLDLWNNLSIERISRQLPDPVLPVFMQPDLGEDQVLPPIPFQPILELDEGPHLGYALQWFSFATILFIGYPFYLRRQE